MKKDNIQENFFTEIAKVLTFPTLLKNLKKAEKMMEEDQELKSYIESARFHLEQAEKKMPDFCKRHPESEYCKEKGKKGK